MIIENSEISYLHAVKASRWSATMLALQDRAITEKMASVPFTSHGR
jgi:hypothetical protein